MEVISLEKAGKRVRLTLDDEVYTITHAMLAEWPLHVGDVVDGKAYQKFVIQSQYKPCLEYAVTLLTARAYAEKELEDKLLHASYDKRTVQLVMYKLRQSHLLNDTDYAQMYTKNRVENQVGRYRIARELQRKGVDKETIQETLQEIPYEDQMQGAKKLVERQLKAAKKDEDPRKTAQRITGALVRRGYSFDIAKSAIAEVQASLAEMLDDDI